MTIVDSAQTTVGTFAFVDSNTNTWVNTKIGDDFVLISINQDRLVLSSNAWTYFGGGTYATRYYTTADCSGTEYIQTWTPASIGYLYKAGAETKVDYAGASFANRSVSSTKTYNYGTGLYGSCSATSGTYWLGVKKTSVLSFTAPFSVK